MRANDQEIHELRRAVLEYSRPTTEIGRQVRESKDPYVNLARAVLVRAVQDALLEDTPRNQALRDDALAFLDAMNVDLEFWRAVGRV